MLKRNWKLNQPTYLDYSYSMIFPANNKNQYPVRKTALAHALRAVIRFQAHYKRSVCAIQYAKICLSQSPTWYYCNRLPLLTLGSIYGVCFNVNIACHHFVKCAVRDLRAFKENQVCRFFIIWEYTIYSC